MFFKNNKKQLQKELDDLNLEIFIAQGNLNRVKHSLEDWDYKLKTAKADLKTVEDNIIEQSSFVVDFAAMNAFSIERLKSDKGGYKTVIGYFLITETTKEVKEWTLHCNLNTHNRLASEFEQYMKVNSSNK